MKEFLRMKHGESELLKQNSYAERIAIDAPEWKYEYLRLCI